jgi:hypothetical protein
MIPEAKPIIMNDLEEEQVIHSIIVEANPIMNPPKALANKPMKVTPPFVPLGTFLKVVMRTGSFGKAAPISLAKVSPKAHP